MPGWRHSGARVKMNRTKFSLRIPADLDRGIEIAVAAARAKNPKYSRNDLICDAIREMLEPNPIPRRMPVEPTPVEIMESAFVEPGAAAGAAAVMRSWSEVFARCKEAGEEGANLFMEAVAHIRKWPDGFKGWPDRAQVEWLDANHPL